MYDNNSPESGHRGKLPQHNKGRIQQTHIILRLPCGSAGKEATCNSGDIKDVGLIPGSGRSPGGGHANPLQYSGLENPKDRGAWRATVHTVTKSWTRLKRLNTHTHTVITHQQQGIKSTLPFPFSGEQETGNKEKTLSLERERKNINTLDFTFQVHS